MLCTKMPLKRQVSPTLSPISKACQLPCALEVPLLPVRGRCCSPWCSAGHKKLSWGGHGDQERATTHPRVTSMEKGQPSPGRDLRCQGLGGFVAQTLAGEDPGPPRELHTTCPFSSFPFLPSRSEPPDLQGLHNSVRKPPSWTPSICPHASQRKTTVVLGQSRGQGDSEAPPCEGLCPFAALSS